MMYTLPKNCLEALHRDDFDEYRKWHCAFCGKNRGGIYTTRLYYTRDDGYYSRVVRACEECCQDWAHQEVKWEDLPHITIDLEAKWQRDKRLFKQA